MPASHLWFFSFSFHILVLMMTVLRAPKASQCFLLFCHKRLCTLEHSPTLYTEQILKGLPVYGGFCSPWICGSFLCLPPSLFNTVLKTSCVRTVRTALLAVSGCVCFNTCPSDEDTSTLPFSARSPVLRDHLIKYHKTSMKPIRVKSFVFMWVK